MASRASRSTALPFDYVSRTRALPINLLFLMPWLLIYQLSLFFTRSPVDNAAAAWCRAVLSTLGRQGLLVVTLLVALGLCIVVLIRVREAAEDRGVFGGMLLEGLLYGALLGTAANLLASSLPMERLVAPTGPAAPAGEALDGMRLGLQDLGLAVGAGIFEELLFRGLLVGGLYMLLHTAIGTDRISAGVISVLVAAYLFSDYHHWGVTGEPYDARVFAFRFHAGVLLGAVFLFRGLGIAAFAHGFYDVMVLLAR